MVAVKGKTIGVSVYEILSRKDDNTNAEVHDLIVAQCETTVLCWKSGARADERIGWRRYSQGFECYKARKFDDAAKILAGLKVRHTRSQLFRRTANQRVVVAQGELASLGRPEDLATEILLERCKRFAENPPAEPWDGVDKVTKKKF